MVNEIIDWYKKKKKKLMIFKVDFAKTYDSISWDYVLCVMKFMGFGSKWIAWINACLVSSRSSILMNGSPTKEFKHERGLRQGDPLSPFLYVIAMEGLHVAMKDAVDHGLFIGAKIGEEDFKFFHLFYADNALFMGKWSEGNVLNLVNILNCFYLVSGLKVNLHKSNLFGIGVDMGEVDSLALHTGCRAASFPIIYFGLPIGRNMNQIASWEEVINHFNKGYRLRR